MAKLTAVQCAHDILHEYATEDNELLLCCVCKKRPYTELHHVYGRGNRKYTGEILFATLFPVDKECHAKDDRGEMFDLIPKTNFHGWLIHAHIQRMIAKGIKVFAE